ncbi:MAG: hypothetical protein ACRYFX_10065 [Janthinobacterium lividum]
MSTPTSGPSASFIDWRGKLITEGTRFYCYMWGWSVEGVHTHFLWHAERSRSGRLVLVADGEKTRRLPLTEKRTQQLVVYTPAEGLGWPDFPEQWSWWRAHGWGVVLREVLPMDFGEEPGIDLQAYSVGRVRGAHWDAGSWRLLQQHPHALRRQLGEALYYVLHPRKALSYGGWGENPLPDEVYLPFVEQQRRKMRKLIRQGLGFS